MTEHPTGYLVCRICGKREAQSTYHCDVVVVCKNCDPQRRGKPSNVVKQATGGDHADDV